VLSESFGLGRTSSVGVGHERKQAELCAARCESPGGGGRNSNTCVVRAHLSNSVTDRTLYRYSCGKWGAGDESARARNAEAKLCGSSVASFKTVLVRSH